ncbi:MAG: glycosyltransferase [Vibrio ordalii]|uniref:glycosyltransferase n=1 Tax=Vibrio TaxID=662 RepID=UPI003D2FC4ED
MQNKKNLNVVLVAHYYPPINSSGAKRFQFLSKYLIELGAQVCVITTTKSSSDGVFSELTPFGVELFELNGLGSVKKSVHDGGEFVPLHSKKPSFTRRIKNIVMNIFGQIPDPRMPFAFSLFFRRFPDEMRKRLEECDVIVATTPPWSMLLAGLLLSIRFKKKVVFDFRDHFSYCHEMPGGYFAKKTEYFIDRWITKKATKLVVISEPMKSYYDSFNESCTVIANGYDHESMEKCRQELKNFSNNFEFSNFIVISYMGIISEGRIPKNFILALDKASNEYPELLNLVRLKFYGNSSLLEDYLKKEHPSILPMFVFSDFVPYETSLKLMLSSDYLLFSETSNTDNLSSMGILTTKLFEYLGTGRPILADISKKTLAGGLIASSDSRNLVSISYLDFYNAIVSNDFLIRKDSVVSDIALSYTRKGQAECYFKLLNEIKNV